MKRLFCLGLAFLLTISFTVSAEESGVFTEEVVTMPEEPVEKLYCDATLEDDFEEQELLITFTQAATVINY